MLNIANLCCASKALPNSIIVEKIYVTLATIQSLSKIYSQMNYDRKPIEMRAARKLAREKGNLKRLEQDLGYSEADAPLEWGVSRLLDKSDESIRIALLHILVSRQDDHEINGEYLYAIYKKKCQSFWSSIAQRQPSDYQYIIRRVARKIGVKRFGRSTWEIEQEIVSSIFEKMLDSSKLKEFQQKIAVEREKHGKSWKSESGAVAAMTVAQASGFGVYLAASTILGGLTSVVGVTAPFVLYTTMSSAISLAIGPFGWGLLAAHVVGKAFGPSEKRIFEATLLIAAARVTAIFVIKEKIKNKKQEIAQARFRVIRLQRVLTRIKRRRRANTKNVALQWVKAFLYAALFVLLSLMAFDYIDYQQRESTIRTKVLTDGKETATTSTIADIKATEELNIYEAVFRFQFSEHSFGQKEYVGYYYISISDKNGNPSDPPADFMKRFVGNRPSVKLLSASDASQDKGVVDKDTGAHGKIFMTNAIQWISETEAEISGGYYEDGLAASGSTYYLRKVDGKWNVIRSDLLWIS